MRIKILASLTVLGFYYPPEAGEKVSLEITILMALTFFMQVVSDMQPPSSDIPIISKYFTFIMVMVACSVVSENNILAISVEIFDNDIRIIYDEITNISNIVLYNIGVELSSSFGIKWDDAYSRTKSIPSMASLLVTNVTKRGKDNKEIN